MYLTLGQHTVHFSVSTLQSIISIWAIKWFLAIKKWLFSLLIVHRTSLLTEGFRPRWHILKKSKWEIPLLRSIIFSGFHFDEVWANLEGDRLEGPVYEGSTLKSNSLVFERNNLIIISRIYELWEWLTTWFYEFFSVFS